MQQAEAPGTTGYRIAVPEDWWTVDLHSPFLRKHVEHMVSRQWRGIDNAPHLRQQHVEQLLQTARDGAANGGDRLSLSLGRPSELPLAASLLVTPLELRPGDVTPEDLAESLGELGIAYATDDVAVTSVDLPSGRGLRACWQQEPGAGTVATVCLDVVAAGGGSGLLLSFRSPLTSLAGPLLELFDAVASTLRFTGPASSGA